MDIGPYSFGVHSFLLAVVSIASLGVGARAVMTESDTREDAYIFTVTLLVALLYASAALMHGAPTRASARSWAGVVLFLAPYCAALSYRLAIELAGPSSLQKLFSILFIAAASFVGLISLGSGVFVGTVRRTWWGWHFSFSAAAISLFVLLASTIAAAAWAFVLAVRNNPDGPRRGRAKWFLAAHSVASVGLLVDLAPALGYDSYPAGYLLSAVGGACTLYAIEKHEFLVLTPAFAAEQIFATLTDPVLVVDPRGEIRVANEVCEETFGYESEELVGASITHLLNEEETPVENVRTFLCEGRARDDEMSFRTDDGTSIVMSVSSQTVEDEQGQVHGAAVVARDIRERKRTERQLEKSRERYELAARGANDGLWDWNLREQSIYFSERWKRMLGLAPDEIGDQVDEWFNRIHPEDRERFESELSAHLRGEMEYFESEHRIRHADGEYRWVLCRGVAIRDASGRATRIAGSQTDITERKRAERKLRHDAFHDALTDVPNRALFMERVEQFLEDDDDPERAFTLLFFDLDRFKAINDSLGHSVGDLLLQRVATRVMGCLRKADTLARIGGDEFGVLLPGVQSESEARRIARRIRAALEQPFQIEEHKVFTSASIGILLGDVSYEQPEDLLRDADIAMYHAKGADGKKMATFQDDMYPAGFGRGHLESDLREALEEDELKLEYQPILDLRTESMIGVEALVRWSHPEYGTISPAEFIPLAEETGLIESVGAWVRTTALRQVADWREAGLVDSNFTMNVNLSPRELSSDTFVRDLEALLQDLDVPPSSLEIEITERILVDGADGNVETFQELDELGVRVCVDDFGTGYSSLSYLRQFGADSLKIDREFVQGLDSGEEDRKIIRSILDLAEKLELEVVAEGVESEGQLERLAEIGITYAQGFLWSRAVPPDEVVRDRRQTSLARESAEVE